MEMLDQEASVVFSQMLQMFPNIPQDVIRTYVQRYSSDAKKCAQMLNLQNAKYAGLQLPILDNSTKLNENSSILQISHSELNSGTILDNNNDTIESTILNESSEQTSYDSHSSYSISLFSSNTEGENISMDCSRKSSAATNFNEPLILDIVPDDDGISHSWRPNVSNDVLCSDLFFPSPMLDHFQLQNNHATNMNLERNYTELHMNPNYVEEESGRFTMTSPIMYEYHLPTSRNYSKDIASYLHYQKSQMNAIRYEVIKTKIELSDVKENVESLDDELKEKMQSKNVQDILNLNKEIEELRIDCQCLCSEIDSTVDDCILLGDVDERVYKKKSCTKSEDTQDAISNQSTNSNESSNSDLQNDSNRWQCPDCTFANHPAINVCEMCHSPKCSTRTSPFLPVPSSSCYCHPKENSLSVQS